MDTKMISKVNELAKEYSESELLQALMIRVTTYEGLKATKKVVADKMKEHPDAPKTNKKKPHLVAQKADEKAVLTQLMGRTEARKKARTLITQGVIDHKAWSIKEDYNPNQAIWALGNMEKLSLFLSEDKKSTGLITPKDVIKAAVKAGEMKATAFTKVKQHLAK